MAFFTLLLQDKVPNDAIIRRFVRHVRAAYNVSEPNELGQQVALFSRTKNRHILNEVRIKSALWSS